MLKDTQLRKNIVASVIASVLFIAFIQPILRFIWILVSSFSAAFYTGFVDALYKAASLGHRNHVDVQIFGMILAIFVGGAIGMLTILSPKEVIHVASKIPSVVKRGLTILFSISLITSCLICLTFSFVDLQLNTSFQQQLTVLAPSITDMQYKELKADWASMTSKRDYDALQSRLEQLAKDNKINLPPLLL